MLVWPLDEAGGNGHREVARRDQADFADAAELDLGGADLRARLEQRLGRPGAEAPLHQPHRFLDALHSSCRRPATTIDQPPAVLLGRAGEAVAGLVGVAGLQAVGARHLAEDRVAVGLGDVLARAQRLAPGEARLAVELLVELGMVLDLGPGQRREVARGDVGHAIVGPAVGGCRNGCW